VSNTQRTPSIPYLSVCAWRSYVLSLLSGTGGEERSWAIRTRPRRSWPGQPNTRHKASAALKDTGMAFHNNQPSDEIEERTHSRTKHLHQVVPNINKRLRLIEDKINALTRHRVHPR
jgi:hypothetical protein